MRISRLAYLLVLVSLGCHAVPVLGSSNGQPSHSPNADLASRPNIVFILADDLGYGDLGCYGQTKIKTPNLDQMAREGIKFLNFYSGSTVCAPSRAVLMTGMHMGHVHVRGNAGGNMTRQSLRDEDLTVAEILKQRGYRTALCGKWGLGENTKTIPESPGLPNKQGFDYFYGYQSQTHAHNYYPAFLWENETQIPLRNEVVAAGRKNDERLFVAGYATKRIDYSHDLIMEKALSFVRNNKSDPFFLYLALTIPHANNEGTRGTGNGQEVPDYGIYQDKPDWSEQDKGQAAMITRMDAGVGRLMELLKELKIDEQTIVMFTSDNGPHNEGGHNVRRFNPSGALRGMKRDLYEGGIRVPMIVRWPGKIPADRTSDHISYFGDFLATACELTDTKVPPGLDSISFLPTLLGRNDQQKHDYLYWEFYEQGSKQAILENNWKAIRIPMFTGEIELYDLDSDISESNNVAASHPQIVDKMKQRFDQSHHPHPNWKVRTKPNRNSNKPKNGRKRLN